MRYILITALLLNGCATQQDLVWHKDRAGMADYNRDHRSCNYDAQKAFYADINSPLRARYVGGQIYDACMHSRGWNQVPRNTN